MCNSCQEIKLRDTPATERELAKMHRHRKAGTAPAMPSWYQAHVRAHTAAPWRAGLTVDPVRALAAERKRIQNAPQVFRFPEGPQFATTAAYIAQFAYLNDFRP